MKSLEEKVSEILFDLGKNIKILHIDDENTILDIPYKDYVDQLVSLLSQNNQ